MHKCKFCENEAIAHEAVCGDCVDKEIIVNGSNRYLDLYSQWLYERELEDSAIHEQRFIDQYEDTYLFTNH